MRSRRLSLADTLKDLPPEWPQDQLPAIRTALRERGEKVVVLDDDPTGTQTVHDVPVVTDWSLDTLADELAKGPATLYLLTNSRSLPVAEARSLNAEIGRNLLEAARRVGREFVVVSRSDSTLRGHFPEEVEALADALDQKFDAWLLVPFFLEGGRYTIGDVHYVAEGEWLIPAGESEFARDRAFGYRASDLRQWVEEKSHGRIRSEAVASISLEDVRRGGPERVAHRLASLAHGGICIVNAASMRDLEVFTQGLLAAERGGQRFLYRTSASFVRARSGLTSRPLLTPTDMDLPDSGGGLVVVGSHVTRTTTQLEHLLRQERVTGVEVPVHELLSQADGGGEIQRVADRADRALRSGSDVVLFTSRRVVAGEDAEGSLSIGQQISDGLVAIVRAITARPRYILAKGGITSSSIATQGLDVRRAMVPGQIMAGVPVWTLGPESRYPGLRYIIFPGNVGGPQALAETVASLRPTT